MLPWLLWLPLLVVLLYLVVRDLLDWRGNLRLAAAHNGGPYGIRRYRARAESARNYALAGLALIVLVLLVLGCPVLTP